jgi:hypothetical protein
MRCKFKFKFIELISCKLKEVTFSKSVYFPKFDNNNDHSAIGCVILAEVPDLPGPKDSGYIIERQEVTDHSNDTFMQI